MAQWGPKAKASASVSPRPAQDPAAVGALLLCGPAPRICKMQGSAVSFRSAQTQLSSHPPQSREGRPGPWQGVLFEHRSGASTALPCRGCPLSCPPHGACRLTAGGTEANPATGPGPPLHVSVCSRAADEWEMRRLFPLFCSPVSHRPVITGMFIHSWRPPASFLNFRGFSLSFIT